MLDKNIEEIEKKVSSLKSRYRLERDKRLRNDGTSQYIELERNPKQAQFAQYLDDPYAMQHINRAPLNDHVKVAIIGGGFGGLIAGAKLKKLGITDVRIFEKASDFGGTWYWNRYPGAACDIESYIYFPMLEEMGYLPVEKYSKASEIFEYSQQLAKRFDLYDGACLQTEVVRIKWSTSDQAWHIHTDRQDCVKADSVIVANGPMNRPKLPKIAGIEEYQGHSFHTSRWDYEYTGGDRSGNLVNLTDKKVGIIGTGATAVQCIPHLGETSQHLHVFQRTPSSIDVRGNKPTDENWVKSLTPGWHKNRMENFNNLITGLFEAEDLVNDGWTDIIRNLIHAAKVLKKEMNSPEEVKKRVFESDMQKMDSIRARVEAVVNHPETAEALKPWYRQFCKRPCFHDEYLDAFNRENVTLVDTDGKGIDRITAKGVVANGVEYELDCLIYATGFSVGSGLTSNKIYPIIGKNVQSLQEEWQKGVRSLHGITVHGYPNLFILGGPQGGFTANYPHNLAEQSEHVAYMLKKKSTADIKELEPTAEAVQDWVTKIIETYAIDADFQNECTPGYYNNEGKSDPLAPQASFYGRGGGGGGSPNYFDILKRWRDTDDLTGMQRV